MATATAPRRRQNLVAVTPGGGITEDMLAGHYFWYSIPEQSISLTRARRAFRDAGLDDSLLPTERRGEHVAMEACSKVQRVTQNGHREEIHADQVLRDGSFLIYQITRHVQDKQNRVIEHPKALRVLYSFETGQLSFEALGGASRSEVQFLIDEITEHFDKNASKLSGHNLRTILRHYIEAAGAESMRGQSGGVYFMAQSNPLSSTNKLRPHHGERIRGVEFIEAVKDALTAIYGRPPEWHSIPCINDEGQRDFLKRKFIENCTDDLKSYRDECLDLVRGKDDRTRGFRKDKTARMVEQRKEMDTRRQKFAEILGETLGELDRDMQLADKALARFLKEAE